MRKTASQIRSLATLIGCLFSLGVTTAWSQTPQLTVPASGKVVSPFPGQFGLNRRLALSGDHCLVTGGSTALIYRILGPNSFQPEVTLGALPSGVSLSLEYGTAVDLDGDVAVVSDVGEFEFTTPGRVFVYRRVGNDWGLEDILPDAQGVSPNSAFGQNLTLSGERMLISEPGLGVANFGRVVLAEKLPGTSGWSLTQTLSTAPIPPVPNQGLGDAMDLQGDLAAVSLPGRNCVLIYRFAPGVGFELVHVLQKGGLVTDGSVIPPMGFGTYGASVAITGSTIFVGDPQDGAVLAGAGAVEVFTESPSGELAYEGSLTASDALVGSGTPPVPGTSFGAHVAASENQLLVNAPRDQMEQGASYLFAPDPTSSVGWVEVAKVIAADSSSTFRFGWPAAVDGLNSLFSSFHASDGGIAYYNEVAPASTSGQSLELSSYCNGDGGDQLGCTDCPCGNNQVQGRIGGCLNSYGTGAKLAGLGRASLTNDTFQLEIAEAVPRSFALLVVSNQAAPGASLGTPCPVGRGVATSSLDGLMCLGGGLDRLTPRATDSDGNVGVSGGAGWSLGNGIPLGLSFYAAGQEVFFQAVYRDAGLGTEGTCGRGLNTTNAIRVMIQP